METFSALSPVIQKHIRQITVNSGLPENDESYELLASAWNEKRQCFENALSENDLEEVDFFAVDEERGCLVLTYSGSLINIGPLGGGARRAEYTSIGLRTDVPGSAINEKSTLASDVETDSIVSFSKGPIQQSSPVFKIAVSAIKLEPAEEQALLTQITRDVAEES